MFITLLSYANSLRAKLVGTVLCNFLTTDRSGSCKNVARTRCRLITESFQALARYARYGTLEHNKVNLHRSYPS